VTPTPAARLEGASVWVTCSPGEWSTLSFLLEEEGAQVHSVPPFGAPAEGPGLQALAEQPGRIGCWVVDAVESLLHLERAAQAAGTAGRWRALPLACAGTAVARVARLSGFNVRAVEGQPTLLARVVATQFDADGVVLLHAEGDGALREALEERDVPVTAVVASRPAPPAAPWEALWGAPPDAVIFTSAAAVGRLEEAVGADALAAWLQQVRCVAAGPGARAALRELGKAPEADGPSGDEAVVEQTVAVLRAVAP
jgi:uroporphyrinogen-III synthase